MDNKKRLKRKVNAKLKTVLLMLLAIMFVMSSLMTVSAATIKDDGKYTLLLTCASDGKIDGDYAKIIRFDVADGDTTVSLSELTAGILPFNGRTQFAYWATDWSGETRAPEDIPLSDFNSVGTFWVNDGEVDYTNGLTIYAAFSEEALKGTGTYYLTLDGLGGTVNGKYEITLKSSSSEYQTVDLTQYVPVREGYTFNGWNTKKDGSGKNYKYVYWRFWDNNEETNSKFDKDTLITEESGYERYKNVTLYASWTKNNDVPENPGKPEPPTPITPPASETVNKLESKGETNAVIEFPDGINKDYKLDIREVEVKKDLADKNVKFIADINVLDGNNNVVKISDTKMKIKIALPEDLKDYDKYEVVYISDGEIRETIPATVEDGYIVFEATHLSQYGIVATSKSVTNVNIPKTGDTNSLALWLSAAIVSCGALTLFIIVGKKKKAVLPK